MLGAIIGDIAGSRYEHRNTFSKDITLIDDKCEATDDSICTAGIAKAIVDTAEPEKLTSDDFGRVLHRTCNLFLTGYDPELVAFGRSFLEWLRTPLSHIEPYGSKANGAAMRISPIGDAGLVSLAKASAACTHNSTEAMEAAEVTARIVDMAWSGAGRSEILQYATRHFRIPKSVHDIRSTQTFTTDCVDTVTQAVRCFLDSDDFEDAIKNAISVGGDSDTLAAITGGFAEAYYKRIPAALEQRARPKMGRVISGIMDTFYGLYFNSKVKDGFICLERRKKRLSMFDDDQFVMPAK